MQFLEGETLEARLKKGRLPLDQALQYAIQTADALDKAHRAGIVHRDLKPGNVMLTKAGAKLLDFGLAKATGPVGAAAGLSMLPTTPPGLTAQGTILGTFQYMAPEQLEGKDADARTDIFALGAVLYEMLTGKKAFEGHSHASLIAAILDREPAPVSSVQRLAPPTLDRVVKKCLAKDPDDRWQTSRDLLDELQWTAETGSQAGVPAPAVGGVRPGLKARPYGWIAAAVLLVTTLALAAAMYLRRAPVDTYVYRNTFAPPADLGGAPFGRLALSPDGRRLAFVAPGASGRAVVWVRALKDLAAQPLAGTEDAVAPFWSPNSRVIAFVAGGKLKRIEASGGPVIEICDALAPIPGTWNRDEVILFTTSGSLSRVAAAGGTPAPVTALDSKAGELSVAFPFFLPDGRHFLYAVTGGAGGVYVGSLDSTDRTRLIERASNAQYAQGYLLFLRDTTLMAQPFNPTHLALTGEAIPLAEQVVSIPAPSSGSAGAFTVSDTGVLVFQAGATGTSRLVWFDRAGKQTGALGDQASYGTVSSRRGTRVAGGSAAVALSPDGRHAAVNVLDASRSASDVWVFDVARGFRTRFTLDSADEGVPIWSKPDGSSVVFRSARKGHQDLYLKELSSAAGTEEELLADRFDKVPESWSPNGRYLLYYIAGPTIPPNQNDVWVLPLFGDRKPSPFLQSPFTESASQFSPNGRWVAYQSDASGRDEVYVVRFPGADRKTQISTAGGRQPRWRRDGKEIFFLAASATSGPVTGASYQAKMMAATVTADDTRFEVGTVKSLFDVRVGPLGVYDVSQQDGRFLVNTVEELTGDPLTIVVNWPALLRK
jgi:Tol biopolymer transport system component